MATVLSTTEAELIGFQDQLCRVSYQSARAPLTLPYTPYLPLPPTLAASLYHPFFDASGRERCSRLVVNLYTYPDRLTGRLYRFCGVKIVPCTRLCPCRFQWGWIQARHSIRIHIQYTCTYTVQHGSRVSPCERGKGMAGCSRIIKGSPGRTDGRINKPGVMNESGSL